MCNDDGDIELEPGHKTMTQSPHTLDLLSSKKVDQEYRRCLNDKKSCHNDSSSTN